MDMEDNIKTRGDIMSKIVRNCSVSSFVLTMLFFLVACGGADARVEEANQQITRAIGNIRIAAGTTNDILEYFRFGDGRIFSSIVVDIDFEDILDGVPANVFFVAREHANRHIDNMYADLALMFERTNHLTIMVQNVSILEDFETPDALETQRFPIEVGRFIRHDDKFLRINTHYGNLDVFSEFFYGRTGFNEIAELIMFFSYYDDDVANTEIGIAIYSRQQDGELLEIDVQNPGKSSLLAIPLSSDFMRGANNELLYNIVYYVDINGNVNGRLPRSFISGDNLYVYFNRTGRFRLGNSEHGHTENRADFLADRGIVLSTVQPNDESDETFVTRGSMYDALMMIHWVENLHHDFGGSHPFPDLARIPDNAIDFRAFTDSQRLSQHIRIGQSLGAFPLVGFENGFFEPNFPLRRSQLFRILAGYIEAFGIDVNGLMLAEGSAIGRPTEDVYWQAAFNYLEGIGFVPYRRNGSVADVAAYEYVTLEEAQEILFRLITTRHFR